MIVKHLLGSIQQASVKGGLKFNMENKTQNGAIMLESQSKGMKIQGSNQGGYKRREEILQHLCKGKPHRGEQFGK